MSQRKIAILKERPKKDENNSIWLSVSKVKTFGDCKAKYKFGYIEKLPRKTWEHHVFGKFAHEALERFHQKMIDGATDPYHYLMTLSFKETSDTWKDKISKENKKEIWNILNNYLKLLADEKNAGLLPNFLEVEKQFYIDIDGKLLLNGFIDRVQLDHDGVMHVTDYKTSKSKKYLANDFLQLKTYAYVMCAIDPNLEKVRTSYMMLRHNCELLVKEFTRKEIMGIENLFIKYAKDINEEKSWKPNTSPLCSYCDFLSFCDEGIKSVRKKNNIKFGVTEW